MRPESLQLVPGSPGKSERWARPAIASRSIRWRMALVIGPLGLAEGQARIIPSAAGVVQERRDERRLLGRRAGEEVAGVVEHHGPTLDRPDGVELGALCSPEMATLCGAKLYGPMPNMANGGWPR